MEAQIISSIFLTNPLPLQVMEAENLFVRWRGKYMLSIDSPCAIPMSRQIYSPIFFLGLKLLIFLWKNIGGLWIETSEINYRIVNHSGGSVLPTCEILTSYRDSNPFFLAKS